MSLDYPDFLHNLPIWYDWLLPSLFSFPHFGFPAIISWWLTHFLVFSLVIILHDRISQGLFLALLSPVFLIFLGNLIHILALAAVHMQLTQPKCLSCIQDTYNILMNCQMTIPVFTLQISCVLITFSRHSFWVSPLMDCTLIHSVNPGSSLSPPRTRSPGAIHYILSRYLYWLTPLCLHCCSCLFNTSTPTPTPSVLFWIIKLSPCLLTPPSSDLLLPRLSKWSKIA